MTKKRKTLGNKLASRLKDFVESAESGEGSFFKKQDFELIEDAGSQDKKVALEAQRKIAAILSEPLIMRGYEDDEGVDK